METINNGGPAFPGKQYVADDETGGSYAEYYTGMSLREYAAIHLRVPDSGTDWLDEMIRKAKRDAAGSGGRGAASATRYSGAAFLPSMVARAGIEGRDVIKAARERAELAELLEQAALPFGKEDGE